MRSHVQKGRSVVTGSSSRSVSRLPTRLPFRAIHHDVLGVVAHEEGFPVISRFLSPRLLSTRATSLPDKEFRYLRTLIVRAAVYQRLGSELRLAANPSP